MQKVIMLSKHEEFKFRAEPAPHAMAVMKLTEAHNRFATGYKFTFTFNQYSVTLDVKPVFNEIVLSNEFEDLQDMLWIYDLWSAIKNDPRICYKLDKELLNTNKSKILFELYEETAPRFFVNKKEGTMFWSEDLNKINEIVSIHKSSLSYHMTVAM